MTDASGAPGKLRIDKWLWHARFFRSRGLAGEVAASGTVRVNGERISKAAHTVRPGDVLTFPQGRAIRVVRVVGLGGRRGPAVEARALYDDLESPAGSGAGADPAADPPLPPPQREPGAGRPTKRERRDIEALRGRDP